ncbi:hypothetical protein Poli38472_007551 [Pythium oligandrum]|uniref:Short-chain dehydrogenase/reductase n=1 Tax=Pythium oligandrum TaxID=41045 RepID=A0A8K1CRF1_PYTOL|nr:hypothetical protein Poli38472_007551 [Pythium oligandrum]|eukprot:TMW67879.1 hypothetical protein Poli38472_007551 [Pythium oligandrum]
MYTTCVVHVTHLMRVRGPHQFIDSLTLQFPFFAHSLLFLSISSTSCRHLLTTRSGSSLGCSTGLGRELALAARKRGDLVIVTARKVESLTDLQERGCQVLSLDVTADDATVNEVVAKAHAFYGRIDILINNAGIAPVGAVEEASSEEIQTIFDADVFGLLRVTRAVLPYMREKHSGAVANIGSLAGYAAFPGCGIYAGAKAAVALISQVLRLEAAPLGIEVTVVDLGAFKTKALTKGFVHATTISEYDEVTQGFKQAAALGGVPATDAALGAEALIETFTKPGHCVDRVLPSRLPLGVGYDVIQGILTTGQQELDAWKDFTDPEAFPIQAL